MYEKTTLRLLSLRRVAVLIGALTCAEIATAAALRPVAVERFFVTPNERSVLRFRVESPELAGPVEYTLRDYWDRPVGSGQAKLARAGAVEVSVSLSQGFYDLDLPATRQRFGVVSLPAYAGKRDPFFSIDSALSWLVRDDELREGLVKALRRSGVAMSRERLRWSQVNPAERKWDWEASDRYDSLRQLYARERVDVLEMFHDAPAWSGRVGKYPKDLVGTARAWRQIGRRWHRTWGALEVWNEPDIHFGANLSADQYVPLVKTAAYAMAQERIDLPLVGGAFAHCNQAFLRTAAENGMLDCVDAVSFHTYGRAPEMEPLVGRYRAWLRTHKREAMPLWITECGRPWRRGPDRPPADQDADSALDVCMKAVEARAGGVARYFAFVYPFYEERDNNFGLMGRRGTPLRSMAAYARLASLLAEKRYLGDLACDDAAVQRARVFGDRRETVAVLYTGRPDAKAKVTLGMPVLRIEGIDGRGLEAARDGSLSVPDGLVYVWLDRKKLGDRLRTDTLTMRLWQVADQEPPRRQAPSPIVLRFETDGERMESKTDGYHLKTKTAKRLPLRVRVFNLSSQPQELTLKLALSAKSARLIGPQTRPAKLAAEASTEVTWEADLTGALAATERLDVSVTAQGKGAGSITPLVISLVGGAAR